MHPEVDKVKATTAPTYYLRFFASLFSATLISLSLPSPYLEPRTSKRVPWNKLTMHICSQCSVACFVLNCHCVTIMSYLGYNRPTATVENIPPSKLQYFSAHANKWQSNPVQNPSQHTRKFFSIIRLSAAEKHFFAFLSVLSIFFSFRVALVNETVHRAKEMHARDNRKPTTLFMFTFQWI